MANIILTWRINKAPFDKNTIENFVYNEFRDKYFIIQIHNLLKKDIQYKPNVDPVFNNFGPIEIRVATVYPIGTSFGQGQHWVYTVTKYEKSEVAY